MKIEIATLFPEMCEAVLGESIIGRARKKGVIDIKCRNIRDYTLDKHRRVDDIPYGGGMGMVMQCDPIYNCYKAVCEENNAVPYTIYMSPKGKIFSQEKAIELSKRDFIFIICGHYEGVDQRIIDEIVDEEISAGDYVLTGGEIPAVMLTDAVARMCDGVLSDSVCFEDESIYSGLLEYPHYTRPENWNNKKVPPVLLSGHHKNIAEWRLQKSIELTRERRPDLLEKYEHSTENK